MSQRTLELGTYTNEHIDAPTMGVFLAYDNYPVGAIIETTCIIDFNILPDTAVAMQHGGSGGASVLSWEGPDMFRQSGPATVKFTIERTAGGDANPIYVFAGKDSGGYSPYEMQFTSYVVQTGTKTDA